MCDSHDATATELAILGILDREGEACFNRIGLELCTTGVCCRNWAFGCLIHLQKREEIIGHYHYTLEADGVQTWMMFYHIRKETEGHGFLGVVDLKGRECKYKRLE
jgi:hypothetical protein